MCHDRAMVGQDSRAAAGAHRARPQPGRRPLSAGVVLALAVLMSIGPAATGQSWVAGVVVVVACGGLAVGWSDLMWTALSVPGRVIIVVAGLVASVAAAIWHHLSAVAVAAGVGIVVLLAAELLVARPPSTERLAVAVTGALVATSGSCWVVLASNPLWEATVGIVCVVVVAAVLGNLVGRSFAANSVGALVGGLVGALGVSAADEAALRAGTVLPTLVPSLAEGIGNRPAVLLAWAATGLSVALAVVAVDGLLGDHGTRRPSGLGALARGCATFLVAVLPFYAMIRVGGI